MIQLAEHAELCGKKKLWNELVYQNGLKRDFQEAMDTIV